MRDCPNCGAFVDGASCSKCGFTEGGKGGKPSQALDPNRHRCADEIRGQRCAAAGSLSESTLGTGPWYCSDHYPPFRKWNQGKLEGMPLAFKRPRTTADLIELELERKALQGEGLPPGP